GDPFRAARLGPGHGRALTLEGLLGTVDPRIRAALDVGGATDLLALAVDHQDGRKTLDRELPQQLAVLLLSLFALLRSAPVIDGQQDDAALLLPRLERARVEDLLLELDAGGTPVAAGEVGEDWLLRLLRHLEHGLIVVAPGRLSRNCCARGAGEKKDDGDVTC